MAFGAFWLEVLTIFTFMSKENIKVGNCAACLSALMDMFTISLVSLQLRYEGGFIEVGSS